MPGTAQWQRQPRHPRPQSRGAAIPLDRQELTKDARRDGGEHKDEQEVEAKERERRRLLGTVQVVQEAGIWDDAEGEQVLRQRVPHRLQQKKWRGSADAAWWWRSVGTMRHKQRVCAQGQQSSERGTPATRRPCSSRSCPQTDSMPCQMATLGMAAVAAAGTDSGGAAAASAGLPAGCAQLAYCCSCWSPVQAVALVEPHTAVRLPSMVLWPLKRLG